MWATLNGKEEKMPDVDEALRMLDAFVGVGPTNFDIAVIKHVTERPDGRCHDEKVNGRQLTNAHFNEVRFRIHRILIEAEQEHWSVIIHPCRTSPAMIIQLDDLPEETVSSISPHAFLVTRTSPGSYQVWVAVVDANAGELARRLKRGTQADTNANGAGKIAGSRNWKPRHAPTFPPVVITCLNPGHKSSWDDLESTGFVASVAAPVAAPVAPGPGRAARGQVPIGLWPDHDWVKGHQPKQRYSSGPNLDTVDAFWCKLAALRGYSLEAIAAKLLRVSTNAQEQVARGNVNYPMDKARWGVAVARNDTTGR
jgi:hypothetical protein